MTMHFAEHETKIIQDEVDPSSVGYLSLESTVKFYAVELHEAKRALEEVDTDIAEIEAQRHSLHIRLLYKREIMMIIDLEADEASIQVSLSEEDQALDSELQETLQKLLVVRDLVLASIEHIRVTQIRHEEAIESRLFTTATSNYY